jgi:hypothetical protein
LHFCSLPLLVPADPRGTRTPFNLYRPRAKAGRNAKHFSVVYSL